ncbi:MAG: SH3 domain-containing protein [bacterium]
MKKRFFALLTLITLFSVFSPISRPVLANGCFEDPVLERSGQVKVIIGARVRSVACMEGSTVLKTLSVGKIVQLIGETSGWLKIRDTDGVEGWVGATLLKITDASPAQPEAIATPPTFEASESAPEGLARSKYPRGCYLDSVTEKTGTVKALYSSRIRNGACSIGTKTLSVLNYGKTAEVLAVTDGWTKIRSANGTIGWVGSKLLKTVTTPAVTATAPVVPPVSAPQTILETKPVESSFQQQGIVPNGIDLVELNNYWLTKVNALRSEAGLRLLAIDQRFINTATEYAGYMGINHKYAHERADGKTMHQWIDTKGLTFTKRYSVDGWQTNYFTENISWDQISGDMNSAKSALDKTLNMFLAEKSANGPHYRTIYHKDWNVVGVGFYFEPISNGEYKAYQVFHYGSLAR